MLPTVTGLYPEWRYTMHGSSISVSRTGRTDYSVAP
jgi:hypothetical protein